MLKTKKLKIWYLMPLVFFMGECTTLPQPPSSISPTTFSIAAPDNFDCFVNHQSTGAPTTKISLFINIITYYYDGTRKVHLDDASVTIDPNITAFPINLTANMPTDGRPSYCEVNMQGTMCSECANYWSDPLESPYSSCPAVPVTTTGYVAAKPRWQGTPIIQSYSATRYIYPISRVQNVVNSCGCTVN